MFWLQKKGYREATLEGYADVFKHFEKFARLDDPEDVKAFVAQKNVSEVRKQILIDKYARYCEFREMKFLSNTV